MTSDFLLEHSVFFKVTCWSLLSQQKILWLSQVTSFHFFRVLWGTLGICTTSCFSEILIFLLYTQSYIWFCELTCEKTSVYLRMELSGRSWNNVKLAWQFWCFSIYCSSGQLIWLPFRAFRDWFYDCSDYNNSHHIILPSTSSYTNLAPSLLQLFCKLNPRSAQNWHCSRTKLPWQLSWPCFRYAALEAQRTRGGKVEKGLSRSRWWLWQDYRKGWGWPR